MAVHTEFLSFPPDFDIQSFSEKSTKICIVAVVGKSRFAPFSSKASILNPVIDRDVYQGIDSAIGEYVDKGELECYYDDDTQVLFLHMTSHLDSSYLVRHCRKMAKMSTDNKEEDFYNFWQDAEARYARLLLMVFSLSHIVLLVHPSNSFDMSYIKFFRILDSFRLKVQPQLTELLRSVPVSKDWAMSGRLCSPRVLFVFHTHLVGPNADDDGITSKSRQQKQNPLKRMQHNLEDQIYNVLRRARVITNISNNSLFAVPANQEFVFINSRKNEAADPITYFLGFMRSHYTGHGSPRTKSYQSSRRGNASSSSSSESLHSPLMVMRSENSFKEFLWQHVEMAFNKGFDDNVGRNPVTARFELPSASLWFAVCQKLYQFFFDPKPDSRTQSALASLRSLLDPDLRFSEGRCSKSISFAEAAYQQDLPPFYINTYHQSKLSQARLVFSQYARGPAYDKYLAQLEQACTAFWKNGHQQCEAVSLSGNLCVNQLHRALSEAVTESTKDLPIMAHSSQLKTRAACNCGQQQADKDDPFDHRSANYDFYMTLEAACCGSLQHIDLPTFRPSGSEVTAVASLGPLPHSHPIPGSQDTGGDTKDFTSAMSALSLVLSLGQSAESNALYHSDNLPDVELEPSQHDIDLSQGQPQLPPVIEEVGDDVFGATEAEEETEEKEPEDKDNNSAQAQSAADSETMEVCTDSRHDKSEDEDIKSSVCPLRQHSTTEYLQGMLHTNCPPGLLPKFPSWALSCLDTADLYNHQHGLDLPGFLAGSNFLLPWDILVTVETERWPSISETKRGRLPRRTTSKSASESSQSTVRVLIGVEYECPRGHRFFCSAPDKIIKVLGNCSVKDTASRLVSLDMPLYTACPCRSAKGFLAQLMRVYTVTPPASAPLQVTLDPQVRPAPEPCPVFSPGAGEIELPPDSIWVLRLPHVYMGDNGPISMPTDPQQLHACVLMKGLFNYRELSADG